jgi:hypothetical protein
LDRWIFQLFITLVLQFTYFSIVIMACIQPIVLPRLSPEIKADAKGLLTILTITWQTLALFPIGDIVTNVLASEWSHVHDCTQELIPGMTDHVSVRTAGFFDHAQHLFMPMASKAFCLAFPASIAALALGVIAPGALSINTVFIPTRVDAKVGSMSLAQIQSDGFINQDRAVLATEVEQFEGGQFIAMLKDPGTFVGLPKSREVVESMGNLTYPSDVMRFDYACRWAAPMLIGMT